MALVGVEDLGRGMPAQRAERPHRAHPADAEQQFLAQPVVAAAAVQPVGDLVQVGLVLLHVGVEQQQRDPADLGHPDLRGQLAARGQAHPDVHRRAGFVAEQLQGQAVRVVGRVPLGLPAVGRQRLGEVAVPVQQADPDQRHAQVAGGLQVVPGQDAQAAGVLRQRGGDAVLGREVGDRGRAALLGPRTSAAPTCTGAGPSSASPSRRRKPWSAASAAIRADGSALSIAIGSPPDAAQAAGSIDANRSAVGRCQDQRRFSIRPCSAASGSGRVTRTVNRRIAFTGRP